jgi:hypothetical protein
MVTDIDGSVLTCDGIAVTCHVSRESWQRCSTLLAASDNYRECVPGLWAAIAHLDLAPAVLVRERLAAQLNSSSVPPRPFPDPPPAPLLTPHPSPTSPPPPPHVTWCLTHWVRGCLACGSEQMATALSRIAAARGNEAGASGIASSSLPKLRRHCHHISSLPAPASIRQCDHDMAAAPPNARHCSQQLWP